MEKSLMSIVLFLGLVTSLPAQDLNLTVKVEGETNVALNSGHQYHAVFKNANGVEVNPPLNPTVYWAVTGGTVVSQTDVFCDIIWTQGGEGHIYYEYMNDNNTSTFFYYSDDIAVHMPVHPLPKPNPTIEVSYSCGSTLVSRTNGPPEGGDYDWWWQKETNGTSTAYGNGSTINLYNNEGLALRARLKISPYTWSESYNVGAYTVYTTVPATPQADDNPGVFEGNPITLHVIPTPSVSYSWYDANGAVIQNAGFADFTIHDLNTTSTFLVSSYKGPCINSSRISISAVIEEVPVISTSGEPMIVIGQPKVLTLNKPYTTYKWKNSYGEIVGTQSTLSVNTEGGYTVTVTQTGIMNEATSLLFSVWEGFYGVDKNYIISNSIQSSTITDLSQLSNLSSESVIQKINYMDGLGRIEQVVGRMQSPNHMDIVQPHVYDGIGREHRKYLPFTSLEQNGHFKAISYSPSGNYNHQFYNEPSDNIADDTRTFSENIYEPRPDDRLKAEYGPGKKWGPAPEGEDRFIGYDYYTNVFGDSGDGEKIIAWELNNNGDLIPKNPIPDFIEVGGYFSSNQLSIKSVKNEDGMVERLYTDKNGNLILRKVQVVKGVAKVSIDLQWASTYYIYDDFGKLVMIMPPEGVKQLKTLFNLN